MFFFFFSFDDVSFLYSFEWTQIRAAQTLLSSLRNVVARTMVRFLVNMFFYFCFCFSQEPDTHQVRLRLSPIVVTLLVRTRRVPPICRLARVVWPLVGRAPFRLCTGIIPSLLVVNNPGNYVCVTKDQLAAFIRCLPSFNVSFLDTRNQLVPFPFRHRVISGFQNRPTFALTSMWWCWDFFRSTLPVHRLT